MNSYNLPGFILLFFSLCFIFYMNLYSNLPFETILFPMILMGILCICSIKLIIQGFIKRRQLKMPEFNWNRVTLLIILGLVYVYILDFLGFIITTILFLFTLLLIAGNRKPIQLISITVVTTVGVYLIFEKLLNVYLP
ncbi:tripartite tricarboxylate transporter TctB family protein [Fredinandcohnia onubensis]|uniref:tripartite tricarboxylate transporter TctB family protein n=1 Tax=Fredinandcohnia onubensis TaxID=1571209 RepID=UPI000C0BE5EA